MMSRPRALIAAGAALALLLAALTSWVVERPATVDRAYMPGPLGHERVLVSRSLRPSANHAGAERRPAGFLTRSIGLRAGEEQEWGRQNGITDGIPFSHSLAGVFPPKLAATHPEYFPLIGGERLKPVEGLANWQPDLGREDVARFAAQQASRSFDQNPEAVSYSLGINDGLLFGESPETLAALGYPSSALPAPAETDPSAQTYAPQASGVLPSAAPASLPASNDRPATTHGSPVPAWFRGRPDYSPLVFTFMNRAAAELAKTHPDKYLGCLAYYWCENVPPFRVDRHVIPFLTADRSQSYDPAFKREEFELQRRWAEALRGDDTGTLKHRPAEKDQAVLQEAMEEMEKERPGHHAAPSFPAVKAGSDVSVAASPRFSISPRLGLYDYLDGYGFLVPRVPIRAFAEHIRHAHRVGFTDYYGESSRNWGLDGPLPWVIAQLLQDPEQNVEALLDEYYAAYFQTAAGPMRRFFERCEEQWMRQPGPSYWLKYYRQSDQVDLFPPEVCRELRGLLDEAARRAAAGDPAAASRPQPTREAPNATVPKTEANLPASGNLGLSWFRPFRASNAATVAQRVAFVSDAFGLTERFVAFEAARRELSAAGFRNANRATLAPLLETYLARRTSFIRYAHALTAKSPLSFSPINYNDWLRDDPAFAAELALAERRVDRPVAETPSGAGLPGPITEAATTPAPARAMASTRGREQLGSDESLGAVERDVGTDALRVATLTAAALKAGRVREILRAGALDGELQPGLQIAGLVFAIGSPAPWQIRVEPTEHAVTELRALKESAPESAHSRLAPMARAVGGTGSPDVPGARYLHLAGQENAAMFQWVRATPGKIYVASVQTRGVASSATATTFTLGWLDRNGKPLGRFRAQKLPKGTWPDWVTLQQGAEAPPGAAWVGLEVRVQHQVKGDFAEFARFSLGEFEADLSTKTRSGKRAEERRFKGKG